jgi:magnesium transporter
MDDNQQIYRQYSHEIAGLAKSPLAPAVLRDKLEDYHASDIADAFSLMSREERSRIVSLLKLEQLAEVFEYMEEDDRVNYFIELPVRQAVALINHGMEPDIAAALLSAETPLRRDLIVDLLDADVREDIRLISSYSPSQIGSKMSTNYIEIPASSTVKEAMRQLKSQAADNDNIQTLYVLDEKGTLAGAIDLKDLIVARSSQPLSDIVAENYPYIYANEQTDQILDELKTYNEDSIPVLNNDNQLIGVITASDVLSLYQEEMEEDYARFAGLSAQEDLEETLFQSVKKRLPWLCILLGLALLVSTVVGMFEPIVAQLTMVAAFQSLILDMSGNVGTQSLAVSIRVLTDDELTWKQKLFLVGKEAKAGGANGLIIGLCAFAVLGVYIYFAYPYDLATSYAISAVIGGSMMVSMLVSSVVGTIIPIFFQSIHVDPAAASGPLITTINDLTAVVTYYSLVFVFLIQVLGL